MVLAMLLESHHQELSYLKVAKIFSKEHWPHLILEHVCFITSNIKSFLINDHLFFGTAAHGQTF